MFLFFLLFLFPRWFPTSMLTSHNLENSRSETKLLKVSVLSQGFVFFNNDDAFPAIEGFSCNHFQPVPHPFHVMRIRNLVWCVPADWLAGWLARSHNGSPQPNPVASKPTNQQTGDHMLPAHVVRATLSLHLFCQPLF